MIQAIGPLAVAIAAMFASSVTATAAGAATPGSEDRRVIVTLAPGSNTGDAIRAHARSHSVIPIRRYRSALRGYAAIVRTDEIAHLRADPQVLDVEIDRRAGVSTQLIPDGIARTFATANPTLRIDGVDERIDADVAVLDTGIDFLHPDLNVASRTNCVVSSACVDDSGTDDNGHGTHVAGAIGAIDNEVGVVAVAPGARLHAVKVLDETGSGWISEIVAGIDWVTAHADVIEVVNMSLGCECSSSAMDSAISNSVDRGILYVVAAGNESSNAANFSPASHPDVITVSAMADFDGLPGGLAAAKCNNTDDTFATFSNFGASVEVAAPGVCIYSTYPDNRYATMSGTSMASPHVAGAAAVLTSGAASPADRTQALAIRAKLVAAGNFDWTDNSGDGVFEPLLDLSDAGIFAGDLGLGDPAPDPGQDPAPLSVEPEPVLPTEPPPSQLTLTPVPIAPPADHPVTDPALPTRAFALRRISRKSVGPGRSLVRIRGVGIDRQASIQLVGGKGRRPGLKIVSLSDDGRVLTIELKVSAKRQRTSRWTVVVTNPDKRLAKLAQRLLVRHTTAAASRKPQRG